MYFRDFVEELKSALKKPLPGREAQFQMIPDPSVKTFYHETNFMNAKKGAVMIVFFQRNKDVIFPMIKRQDYEGVHSGQIALPGGKKDPSDVDFQQTALRETFEEIGIHEHKIHVIGKLSEIYIPPSNFLIYPFVGVLYEEPNYYPDLNEVADIYEINVKDLMNPACITKQNMKLFNGLEVSTPCFNIDQKIIWGGTAMILSEMRTILLNIQSHFLSY
jgi:8-oxo-dGTP pyrophosphatase MutT (NUDIX family)